MVSRLRETGNETPFPCSVYARPTMPPTSLRQRMNTSLARLEALVIQGSARSSRPLSFMEIEDLAGLYRLGTSWLAQARGSGRDPEGTRRLEALLARAHAVLFQPPRGRLALLSFAVHDFPEAVRRTSRFHALAALLMLAGGVLAALATSRYPDLGYSLLTGFYPEESVHALLQSEEARWDLVTLGRDRDQTAKTAFAMSLFSHNTQVGFAALSTGILLGIPTLLLVLFNGAVLGCLLAVYHQAGMAAPLWAWILPHGVTELLAVTLASGAGLSLGAAMMDPGRRTRQVALRERGKDAVLLALGLIPMMLFAGGVEAFVRQSTWGSPARFAFAGATALFWFLYLGRPWRWKWRPVRPPSDPGPPGKGTSG